MMDFIVRRFQKEDAEEVAALIRKTLQLTNAKDYVKEDIEALVKMHTAEYVLERASWTHFYVVCDERVIIGCGAIGPYWGKEDESSPIVGEIIEKYKVPKEMKLFELGCGEGRDAQPLLENGFKLLATDISPEVISYCQKMMPL